MTMFKLFLRLGAGVFFCIGALHLALGPGADVLLGAKLSPAAIADPVLDSQNRFYGVAFTLLGAMLILCARDLERYRAVFYATLGVFFAGGIARIVSMLVVGPPSGLVLVLLVLELLLPPMLVVWAGRVRNAGMPATPGDR